MKILPLILAHHPYHSFTIFIVCTYVMYPFFHAVTHFELLDPENDGTVILRDVSNYVHVEIAQHPRRLESPATPLWKPHIFQDCIHSEIENMRNKTAEMILLVLKILF